MSGNAGEDGIVLTCKPNRERRALVFDYAVTNHGAVDIYVQDAMPSVDPASRATRANTAAATVIHSAKGEAIIGKYLPPMPQTARPALALAPLAFRLASGQSMTRRLEIPEPLAETSPYLPDLVLRRYEMVEIPAVVFTLGFWVTAAEGFVAVPSSYAPDLSCIVVGHARRLLWQRFATHGLQIFRRTDDFPRTLAG